jgi:hypothetical protein
VAFQHGTDPRGVALVHLVDPQYQRDVAAVLVGELGEQSVLG